MKCRFVSYLRVSTQKQGIDGLGIEAQRAAVQRHALSAGCEIVAEFVEVESGRKSDRTELAKALAECRLRRATLVIARLDRLARNVAFLSRLMESGVEFVCADNPQATRLTLHILAAVAEEEARLVSVRTKAALAAWKQRNPERRLGNPNGWSGEVYREGGEGMRRKADAFAANVGPLIRTMRDDGKSLRQIADALNERGIPTSRGSQWQETQVMRVLQRI
jgi:DNA invertase Pin-like site-specific DNA recombinase